MARGWISLSAPCHQSAQEVASRKMYTNKVGKAAAGASHLHIPGDDLAASHVLEATVTAALVAGQDYCKEKVVQAEVNCQMSTTTKAGAETGRNTLTKVPSIPAPSMRPPPPSL